MFDEPQDWTRKIVLALPDVSTANETSSNACLAHFRMPYIAKAAASNSPTFLVCLVLLQQLRYVPVKILHSEI